MTVGTETTDRQGWYGGSKRRGGDDGGGIHPAKGYILLDVVLVLA